MKTGYPIAALLVAILATPALAAAEEYFVVRNTVTNKCDVVSQMPAVSLAAPGLVVENAVAYKSRAEALAAMKAVQVCTDVATATTDGGKKSTTDGSNN
jgi:hypothetical protein